jgi:ribosomal small subunit protein bTHX
MGKGDIKSKKGKTVAGSYGKSRSRAKLTKKRENAIKSNSLSAGQNKTTKTPAAPKKAAAKKAAAKKAE